MTQFKRILKSRRPAAVKPWEEAPETIAQPHVEAGREAEIDEVRDARGSTPGSVAPTPDSKLATGASDVPGPKDGGAATPSVEQADGGLISRTVVSSDSPGAAGTSSPVTVYTDRSACSTLGIRRRVLSEARTPDTRGRDWDVVKEEAGMTLAWIRAYARDNGVPFVEENLEPVTGEYVSVKFDSPHPNIFLCLVKIEATGAIEYCRVRNRMEHSLYCQEAFSAHRVNGMLEWIAEPNECKW